MRLKDKDEFYLLYNMGCTFRLIQDDGKIKEFKQKEGQLLYKFEEDENWKWYDAADINQLAEMYDKLLYQNYEE